MSHSAPIDVDCKAPPLEHFRSIHRLAAARSGHASSAHARHQLYVARDVRSRANVLIKVTSKPGLVYERDLANEIDTLSTINRGLPDSRYFPLLGDHGRLRDGRVYLTTSLFAEWPLATSIGPEPIPARQSAHLRTAIEVARAVAELHTLKIWHLDLDPMNILCRWEGGKPVIRIVDFESSYEVARHSKEVFHNPPITTGFSAPELSRGSPDSRSDVFSLGAVLYTMLAGYGWTWADEIGRCVEADRGVAPELKEILLAAVHTDPHRRFASITDLHAALTAYVERGWHG